MTRALMATWLLAGSLVAGSALADVELRVEARPTTDPIDAFVTVTNGGVPVGGLMDTNFTLTLDGLVIQQADVMFSLPPAQDPSQRVSVIFAMDYSGSVQSTALAAMQDAVTTFIGSMVPGDFAAIIKFNNTNPDRASVVQAFTEIDDGAGDSMLVSAVNAPYPGTGTNLLDALALGIDQFNTPPVPLPAGPKAIILITDGGENSSGVSESTVVADANGSSIPIFTIGVGDLSEAGRVELLSALATETGGDFLEAPDDAEISAAYATISVLLNNSYQLTIPTALVADCAAHTLEVAVTGQTDTPSVTFTRCDSTPNPFNFTDQTNVDPGAVVTSNAVTIVGIEGEAPISVVGGQYSIGCGATFTFAAGTVTSGQTVCVRHTASAAFSTAIVTTLTVGGVSARFTSTTSAAPPPPPAQGGGGGGAMGVVELLLGLGVLFVNRRKRLA